MTAMFNDFEEKYPVLVKHDSYREAIHENKRSHDDENPENCVKCLDWRQHIERARKLYEKDASVEHGNLSCS